MLVSRLDPLTEPPLQGSVVACTGSQVKVSFREPFDLDGAWRSVRYPPAHRSFAR